MGNQDEDVKDIKSSDPDSISFHDEDGVDVDEDVKQLEKKGKPEQISKLFKQIATKTHPDKFANADKEAQIVNKQVFLQAKEAAEEIAVLSTDKKNKILQSMADELLKNSKKIINANKVDLKNSKDLDLTPAIKDRLTLSEERINGMANGLLKIITLEDKIYQKLTLTIISFVALK